MTATIPARSEIARDHTWDAASVFASDADWNAEFDKVNAMLADLARFQGRLHEGANVVLDCLRHFEQLLRSVGKIYIYASMFHEVDTADQEATAKNARAMSVYGRMIGAAAFIDPELISVGFETLRAWMEESADLAVYRQHIDQLERRQQHIRSAEIEEILGQTMEPFFTANATHGILADADMVFKPAVGADGQPRDLIQGTIGALLADADREVRRSAWEHYADGHLALKNTMANALSACVKQHVMLARVRKYESSLEAALSENFIPVDVFQRLIETYRKHVPTWHRYWQVRRKALGYDKLHVYDIKAPLTSAKPDVSYEQAVEWIIEGMRPLGDEYVGVMERGLKEQRWVDIYPNQGKRAGAFSSGVQGTHPFILMSYNDDVFSMSTLAHELGHSMHSYYTWQNQPAAYAHYGLFVAEVASNFNQALVRAHLLSANDDPDFQIAVIEEAMANFHRYFFIMPILAQFELAIHEWVEQGQAITAEGLNTLMTKLFSEGYGQEVEIDADRIGCTWAQFSTHLYANFYVYQYATGISGAHALAEGVLAGAPGARENYLAFLKAGSSLYPLEALKLAGVDLSSSDPVEKTFAVLGGLVDRLEQLVDQRSSQPA